MKAAVRRGLVALLAWPLLLFAGQDCSARKPGADEVRRSLELATETARRLDATGAESAILARVGQDLEAYGLKYSHLGIAYRDRAALGGRGAWRVVHKLNACGTARGDLYRQGLAEFFSDGPTRYEAGLATLAPPLGNRLPALLADDAWLRRLHEPRYNMVAFPWSTRYQQSNQWALETLTMALDPAIATRRDAQRALRRAGYRPDTLTVPAMKRLGARIALVHIDFDDHPFGRRMAGLIDTVTVESVFRWLGERRLGGPPQLILVPLRPLDSARPPLVSRPEKAA